MNVVIEATATYWMQALTERDEARQERDTLKAELAEIKAKTCDNCAHCDSIFPSRCNWLEHWNCGSDFYCSGWAQVKVSDE